VDAPLGEFDAKLGAEVMEPVDSAFNQIELAVIGQGHVVRPEFEAQGTGKGAVGALQAFEDELVGRFDDGTGADVDGANFVGAKGLDAVKGFETVRNIDKAIR
jgi:hypothetical protein